MQYKVPQDVQREDTIIGPLTLKQMTILGIGGGIAYALYVSLAQLYFVEIWLPPVVIVSSLTLAFTFLKVHSLPFHVYLMNLIEYQLLPRKRIWVQGTGTPSYDFAPEKKKDKKNNVSKVNKSNKTLAELTEVLDSHGTKTTEK